MNLSVFARGPVCLVALVLAALSGCADLTVTPVNKTNAKTVHGVRYYLPKPFLIFAPQADGTVTANLVYLPDKSHQYAIDATATMSSYAFQASTDSLGLLVAVQYGSDTTAVASQTAASVAAGVAQVQNLESARTMAVQTQVNTLQTAVISAQSAYASAVAALNSDTQANLATPGTVKAEALQAEASTVAQKLAALQVAQAALQSGQTTPQVVAASAAVGSPVASTPAAAGTAFAVQPGATGLALSLPERFGPVWYAVNDGDTGTSLEAVKFATTPPTAQPTVQPAFATTLMALGPPQIAVPPAPFALAAKLPAVFMFNRPISTNQKPTFKVKRLDGTEVSGAKVVFDNKRSVLLDLEKLKPGGYWLEANYYYAADPGNSATTAAAQQVLFSVGAAPAK